MIEKGRISPFQVAVLMYPTIVVTALLIVPSMTAKHAERDMWISPIWASSIGFLTVYVAYQLHKLYPKQTVIEYSEKILGRFLGKMVGAIFLFHYLHTIGIVFREYAEFVKENFLFKTPLLVMILGMIFVCTYAVTGGAEVLGRCGEVFVPIGLFLLVSIILLLIPDMKFEYMFPIMEEGITPSIIGSFVPQGWFGEFFLISFLLPAMKGQENRMKWGMISVFAVMLTMILFNFVSLFLFGDITKHITYPVIKAVRYISIADFFEHVEALVMAIWVLGAFLKICVFSYAIVIGMAQWLNLSHYHPIVWPIHFLYLPLSLWIARNYQEVAHFKGTVFYFYSMTVQVLIPILLLCIAWLRQRRNRHDRSFSVS
ncbi:GerAB/ArcD/ProY family transporter [Thermoflavimicrobium dichotomicum]|uniref:Spore germination protein KB n=1 Tax=Thermoflavimicrobium dichotomicum TaxID=46223 RepID=A0A1I3TKJ3_9BACL|nr:endospore germination permease [Thermoflavimicrobium dichotomicum]SFJ70919.1 spore germination protein KB [Thermoflavimicrobium dichotomicum]